MLLLTWTQKDKDAKFVAFQCKCNHRRYKIILIKKWNSNIIPRLGISFCRVPIQFQLRYFSGTVPPKCYCVPPITVLQLIFGQWDASQVNSTPRGHFFQVTTIHPIINKEDFWNKLFLCRYKHDLKMKCDFATKFRQHEKSLDVIEHILLFGLRSQFLKFKKSNHETKFFLFFSMTF